MSDTTLLPILTKASDYLKSKGVPNPRLDAELLLANVLGLKRLDLYLQFDRPLTEANLTGYREFIRRRGAREPLQHIEGKAHFRELTLLSDKRALIPRPETELIVDALKKHLPSVENPRGLAAGANAPRVLDIGTGTGAIILSVARELPQCETWACDVSHDALDLMRENAARNALTLHDVRESDLFSGFDAKLRWHAIVSNPPYIGEDEMADLEPEVRDHDPRLALVGGAQGWELPAALLDAAFDRLEDNGILILEIAPSQFPLLKERGLARGWSRIERLPDYQQIGRFLLATR
jgi:release factor glutamine methyltransferase